MLKTNPFGFILFSQLMLTIWGASDDSLKIIKAPFHSPEVRTISSRALKKEKGSIFSTASRHFKRSKKSKASKLRFIKSVLLGKTQNENKSKENNVNVQKIDDSKGENDDTKGENDDTEKNIISSVENNIMPNGEGSLDQSVVKQDSVAQLLTASSVTSDSVDAVGDPMLHINGDGPSNLASDLTAVDRNSNPININSNFIQKSEMKADVTRYSNMPVADDRSSIIGENGQQNIGQTLTNRSRGIDESAFEENAVGGNISDDNGDKEIESNQVGICFGVVLGSIAIAGISYFAYTKRNKASMISNPTNTTIDNRQISGQIPQEIINISSIQNSSKQRDSLMEMSDEDFIKKADIRRLNISF